MSQVQVISPVIKEIQCITIFKSRLHIRIIWRALESFCAWALPPHPLSLAGPKHWYSKNPPGDSNVPLIWGPPHEEHPTGFPLSSQGLPTVCAWSTDPFPETSRLRLPRTIRKSVLGMIPIRMPCLQKREPHQTQQNTVKTNFVGVLDGINILGGKKLFWLTVTDGNII